MALPRIRSQLGGDFLVPSFNGNIDRIPRRGKCRKLQQSSLKENRDYSVSSLANSNTQRHINQRKHPEKTFLRSPLQDNNIGDNVYVKNSKMYKTPPNSRSMPSQYENEEEMKRARNTSDENMDHYSKKCVCLNFEFNQPQEQHGDYLENSKSSNSDEEEPNLSDSSDVTLERKYTEVFKHSSKPTPQIQHKDNRILKSESRTKAYPTQSNKQDLKIILKTLDKMFKKTPPVPPRDTGELEKLYAIVKSLQDEQEKFRDLINTQQHQLNDFQTKYLKAENIIKFQKHEIQQLNQTHTQLEKELNSNINALKEKLQEKITEANHLPQAVKAEKIKAEKLSKQNCELIARLQEVKHELALTRSKLVEAAQKRTISLNKLKSGERDLKIFRNQNSILKTEKRALVEELKRMKDLNQALTAKSSKNMSRQRERGETQQRLLQKKILDLELELTRSRNSTGDLIEERDKLIAELHQQLNTLVHNFEVSQKHIRVLRKHIHTMSGNSAVPQKA